MWTVELTADYRGPYGRIVTDYRTQRTRTALEAVTVADHHWQRVGRRRGTQLHLRATADTGETVTRSYRRD